jgi:hypothetical protein
MDRVAYISRLSLTNFRNLVELELDLAPGVSVFFGANAQGKTTLLEAIYLLAIARSYRAENEREVVNFQSAAEGGQALVGGIVEKDEERLAVYVGYQSVPHGPDPQSTERATGLKATPFEKKSGLAGSAGPPPNWWAWSIRFSSPPTISNSSSVLRPAAGATWTSLSPRLTIST